MGGSVVTIDSLVWHGIWAVAIFFLSYLAFQLYRKNTFMENVFAPFLILQHSSPRVLAKNTVFVERALCQRFETNVQIKISEPKGKLAQALGSLFLLSADPLPVGFAESCPVSFIKNGNGFTVKDVLVYLLNNQGNIQFSYQWEEHAWLITGDP